MPAHPVAHVSEIPPGGRKLVTIGAVTLGVFNVGGAFHAYRNVCPHAGAPVCAGRVGGTTLPSPVYEYTYGREGCILRCPWHGWEFDLETGQQLVDARVRLKKLPLAFGAEAPMEALEKFSVERRGDILSVVLPG